MLHSPVDFGNVIKGKITKLRPQIDDHFKKAQSMKYVFKKISLNFTTEVADPTDTLAYLKPSNTWMLSYPRPPG